MWQTNAFDTRGGEYFMDALSTKATCLYGHEQPRECSRKYGVACRILDNYHWISALSKMPQIFMESFFVLTGFWAAQGLYDSFMKVPRTEAALFVVR